MDFRAVIIAIVAVVAVTGIALAAESQTEEFLHEKDLQTGFRERDSVSGNLVALTGLLVAFGVTLCAFLLSKPGWKDRAIALPVIFVATYFLVLMVQTGMFNYVAEDSSRSAIFSISPIITNGLATPSTFIGPLAFVVIAALGMQQAMRRFDAPEGPVPMGVAAQRFLGAMMLAAPFLIVAIVGNLRLLFALPHEQNGTVPYLIVLPLASAAALAMLILGSIKAWHLAQAVREPRMSVVAQEAWAGLRRAEWAAIGAIAALALLATLLEDLESATVQATAFNLNVQTHSQAQIFLLLPLIPWLGQHRTVSRALDARIPGGRPLAGLIAFWAVLGVAITAAALLTFLIEGALWAWLVTAAPLAILGFFVLPARDSLQPALLAALVLWGIGNTVTGTFQLTETGRLNYDTHPGLLALWRAMAVTLVAAAVSRAARAELPRQRAWTVPLTAGLGVAVALIVFLEFPFSAWIVHADGSEHVAIGTVIASQDPAVRGVLHGVAAVAAFLAGFAVARIRRPDWFAKEPAPVPALADS